MKKPVWILSLLTLLVAPVAGAQEKVDTAMAAKIRMEGLEHSQVMEVFDHLVNVIGPRLTASPAYQTAVQWTRSRLAGMGFDNVHLEPWEFGRGWELEHLTVEMIEPRYLPLIGYAKGWSPSTSGKLVGTPEWLGNPSDSVDSYAGHVGGAIVMTAAIQEDFVRDDRTPAGGDFRRQSLLTPAQQQTLRQRSQQVNALLQKERAGVTLEPNVGEHGTVFVTGRDGGNNAVPSIVLASEHYNMIARLLAAKVPVRLAVDVQTKFFENDKNAYNVIAEIKGMDPVIGDEVVMAGAHLDSWHTGTGATDNADGIAVEMEALRILKALGVKPRRTIRIALWGGEEQGLLGSKAYVKEHLTGDAGKAARDKFSVYFNLDNGMPPITGFYLQGNPEMQPIMEAWLKPLNDLGATISTLQSIGSTDHLSFIAVGLPGYQAVQDYENYDMRTHHTNMDTYERVSPDALKQASVVVATVLYDAAMRDAKVPRAPGN
jgi:carboxypeptidase Q